MDIVGHDGVLHAYLFFFSDLFIFRYPFKPNGILPFLSIGPVHFSFQGLLGGNFYSNFNGIFFGQIVEAQIGCCILWHLIWVCTAVPCPTY